MNVFVARQPIFDAEKNVYAYELLFRSNAEQNAYDPTLDGDVTTTSLVSRSLLVIGLDTLTSGKPAFINYTRNLLLRQAPTDVPSGQVVVEILETVDPDEAVVQACRSLKEAGYTLALDDFVFDERYRPLIDLADIIKIDFRATLGDDRQRVVGQCQGRSVRFLAEKVETHADFQEACQAGYSLFQGYFFCKPDVVQGRDIPGSKLNYIRILQEINAPDISFDNLESVIKHDVSLSYKLLRFLNSSFFTFSAQVESIRHALVLLGVREIKKWVNLVALCDMAGDKPRELVVCALVRARLCESLAGLMGEAGRSADCFLMGLFSLIDGLIDRPLEVVLEGLPLQADIKDALLGGPNRFNAVYRLVLAYEQGEWPRIESIARELGFDPQELPGLFIESVQWANVAM